MREFPASVTRRIRHKATIPPILKALELNKMEHFPIQVARIKKEHNLDVISGELSGNTTAPNQSTAISIRF